MNRPANPTAIAPAHVDIEAIDYEVMSYLIQLYGTAQGQRMHQDLREMASQTAGALAKQHKPRLASASAEAILICYGDGVQRSDAMPLQALAQFAGTYLDGVVSGIHILPFFPSSSDDGFAVVDYERVRTDLGDWPDIQHLAKDFDLMVDLVINHCSREHVWFTDYITNAAPGKDYFHEQEPNPELHQVLRPRNSPLLTEVHTREGVKRVWTTFSEDQVDVNFANPDVLMEFARILFFYARNGARYIRLDAIAYLWKRLGTTCMSLPETHMVVRILRGLIDVQGIPLTLVTETNVPHEENVSYFGEGNEAHWVYQFSLAPLLLYSYLLGDARALVSWTQGLTPAPNGCSYFNFIASHDGIGLRPLEGLLDDADIEQLIDVVHQRGGFASMRSTPTGEERVYELNIALFSAFGGSVDDVDAYVAAHQLLIAYQGVPGLYLNALLGSLNDVKQMEITGRTRSINRGSWRADEVSERLADPESLHAVIFSRLSQSLKSRAQQRAFAPTAQQKFVQGGKDHLMFLRFDETQRILIVASFSAQPQQIDWPAASMALPGTANDLLTGAHHSTAQPMALAPHQVLWLDLG